MHLDVVLGAFLAIALVLLGRSVRNEEAMTPSKVPKPPIPGPKFEQRVAERNGSSND